MSKLNRGNWTIKACGVFLLWATAAVAVSAQTFKTLHTFDNADGTMPQAGLVQTTDGNFYGTTEAGGANVYYGTVFKITPSGALTTLYSFCSQSNCTDGSQPYAELVQATDGNFYGTTYDGGVNGYGIVFKITPSGALTTLYSFCSQSNCTDGLDPAAGLVYATNGHFYGTTYGGGANGYGTVFEITSSGALTTLHSFNGTDGGIPEAALVQAANGKLYGTTFFGGAIRSGPCAFNGGESGCGTVFQITTSGTLETLHSFDNSDGGYPLGLVQAIDGNFYGTTDVGGANGEGTVFKITPTGTLITLHNFCPHYPICTDGAGPESGLVQGTDGNFYGTTFDGGANDHGTVFKITPSGKLTTLHSFDGTDGQYPFAVLLQATNGVFYGTTWQGGANGDGTVFSLSEGLSPFVETLPGVGKVGAAVKILGTFLTGATSVTFNGTAATFTVKSKSEITTTVPAGATTGKVKVVTPSGTLSSNVPFRVTP